MVFLFLFEPISFVHTLPLFTAAILVFLHCGDLSHSHAPSSTCSMRPAAFGEGGWGSYHSNADLPRTTEQRGVRNGVRHTSIGTFPQLERRWYWYLVSTKTHNIFFLSRRGSQYFYLIIPIEAFVWDELLHQKLVCILIH